MAQDDEGGAFTINGIEVDVAGKTAQEARQGGWRHAQRMAWRQLWSRMTGNPVAQAPRLSDSTLDSMVAGIEIERERIAPTRYLARLGVVFDRGRASRHFGPTARVLRSQPMLLLPVLIDGGTRTVYERRSPWVRAWARYRDGASPIDYVRAPGGSGDAVLLTAYQARRPDRSLWRNILTRYGTVDVLTAQARLNRSYPGGPITGQFAALHGPDAVPMGRFELRAANPGELPAMLDRAVRRIDEIYAQALRDGRLLAEEELTVELAPIDIAAPVIAPPRPVAVAGSGRGVEANIVTPDAATLQAFESIVRSTPTVAGTQLVSLALGGTSRIRIGHSDNYETLRYQLDQRGLRLEPGEAGLRLRRRVPGEAPLPRPLTAEELNQLAAARAAEALGVTPPAATPGASPAPAPAPPAAGPTDPEPPAQAPEGQGGPAPGEADPEPEPQVPARTAGETPPISPT